MVRIMFIKKKGFFYYLLFSHSFFFFCVLSSFLLIIRFLNVLKWPILLTYSMVQSPSWEANWFAASQEIPCISRNPKVHYRTHKRPPPVCILGQPNPVHIPTSHLLEIHPNIIVEVSSKWTNKIITYHLKFCIFFVIFYVFFPSFVFIQSLYVPSFVLSCAKNNDCVPRA